MLELQDCPASLQLQQPRPETKGDEATRPYLGPIVRFHVASMTDSAIYLRVFNRESSRLLSERKIDYISERLSGIENLLRTNLAPTGSGSSSRRGLHSTGQPCANLRHESSSSSRGITPSHAGTAETPSTSNAYASYDPGDSDSVFEGESSLAAHTAFASELFEHAVDRTVLRASHPDISGALQSLRRIASMKNTHPGFHESRFPYYKPQPRTLLQEAPMPPMPLVVALLRMAQGTKRRNPRQDEALPSRQVRAI